MLYLNAYKSYTWFQNQMSTQCKFDLKSQNDLWPKLLGIKLKYQFVTSIWKSQYLITQMKDISQNNISCFLRCLLAAIENNHGDMWEETPKL